MCQHFHYSKNSVVQGRELIRSRFCLVRTDGDLPCWISSVCSSSSSSLPPLPCSTPRKTYLWACFSVLPCPVAVNRARSTEALAGDWRRGGRRVSSKYSFPALSRCDLHKLAVLWREDLPYMQLFPPEITISSAEKWFPLCKESIEFLE